MKILLSVIKESEIAKKEDLIKLKANKTKELKNAKIKLSSSNSKLESLTKILKILLDTFPSPKILEGLIFFYQNI